MKTLSICLIKYTDVNILKRFKNILTYLDIENIPIKLTKAIANIRSVYYATTKYEEKKR